MFYCLPWDLLRINVITLKTFFLVHFHLLIMLVTLFHLSFFLSRHKLLYLPDFVSFQIFLMHFKSAKALQVSYGWENSFDNSREGIPTNFYSHQPFKSD